MDEPDHFRLGESLEEEVLACLLGGHGIPAEVGLAAFDRLRPEMRGDGLRDQKRVEALLREPLSVGGRLVRYRFAAQKAAYIAAAVIGLRNIRPSPYDRQLRDQLTSLRGVGPKTASWIVRNWRRSDEVAILDIHILRAGYALGIFKPEWRVERHYDQIEQAFLAFAARIGTRASILDSVIWMTMRQLPPLETALRPKLKSTTSHPRGAANHHLTLM